ncbi:short tail fibers protein [Escherichia phage AnYang]|uniref:Short tail fibers protein n=1 Tax=Escherichia phage AnYang TaxID=2499909 RepID=A0A410T4L8_9CAUD|nr:tail collar fiber protein [Escherichia phage AnYang]QAU03635.1 short tail fibers protein [Escherichia phage AnYang]
MSTNTLKHISDKSEFKTFDPTGSNFDPSITNVQDALASISAIGVTGNIPSASETEQGIIRLATQQEVIDGTDTFSAVTPATLKGRLDIPTQATETYVGITRYATNAEAIAGTETQAAIVASSLKATIDYTFTNRLATENTTGVLKISTLPAALAGTDDTTAMTPLKTAQAIGAATSALPTYASATQTTEGIVRIATNAEVANGTLTNGVAISPSGLKSLTSTQGRAGIIRLATPQEASAGSDSNIALSPSTLLSRTGTTGRLGVVKLSTTVGSGDGNTALAYNANVISTTGGTINGTLNVNGTLRRNGRDVVTIDQLKDSVPIGTIVMWGGQINNIPAGWAVCDGGNSGEQGFRNVVGSKWGSTGARPDFRGLYPRGANQTNDGGLKEWDANVRIRDAKGNDAKGKPKLGVGCGSYGHGTVQAQQLRFHKHAGGFGEHDNAGAFGNTVRSNFAGTRKGLDWDNRSYFTNEGYEIDGSGSRDSRTTLNSEGLIGNENRPWTMSILFIIKVA